MWNRNLNTTALLPIEHPPERNYQVTRYRTFECPIQACLANHSCYEDLQCCIRNDHSTSNHSLVLGVVFTRQPLRLSPLELSQDKFIKDKHTAERSNPRLVLPGIGANRALGER
jgi:hypothetical protein